MQRSSVNKLFHRIEQAFASFLKCFKGQISGSESPSQLAIDADFQILKILMSALEGAVQISDKDIQSMSHLLNADPDLGNQTKPLDPKTLAELNTILENFEDPVHVTDAMLEEALDAINGMDPELINEFLNKLIGKLDPATLEKLFRKIFGRLLSKKAVVERVERDALESLSQKTREFLRNLKQKTLGNLSKRVRAGELNSPITELNNTIKQLSAALATSEIADLTFAGTKLSKSLQAAKTPKEKERTPGVAPGSEPDLTPRSSPEPSNRPGRSPWKPPRI